MHAVQFSRQRHAFGILAFALCLLLFLVYPPSFLGPTCAIGALDGGFARQCHSPPRATSAGSQATRR